MKSIKNLFVKDKFGLKSFKIEEVNISEPNFIKINSNIINIPYYGNDQVVAVLDTGVDSSHDEIKGKVTSKSFLNDETDSCGHGTFVVGEIISKNFGIAPNANAISYKVLYGDGRDSNLLNFEKCVSDAILDSIGKCGVISMSFGTSYKSKKIENAINLATDNGVICIASCGNEGIGSPYKSYPAAFENCISVASADRNGLPSWFSTAGKEGYIFEQPEIAVASLTYHIGILPNNKFGRMTGTSISCPIISALALIWREMMVKRNKLPEGSSILKEFRNWLFYNANDTNNNGWDNELGFGVFYYKGDN